ncbi:MAG TPA: alpha/beta fold hydrolase [Roseiarcus sp.]|nr:alpha/beta fold hydrolase [Roseiarcus sp.]
MNRIALAFGLGLLSSIAFSTMASAAPPQLETKSFTIPSVDPGIELYMRNKHPVGMTTFSPDKTVLFIHGATYPAETSFDLPIEGVSMMDLIAQQGYDVFLVDIRGYGGSTRPAEMDQPPTANKPLATSADAAKDLGAAIDYVLKTRNIPKLNLFGWSWGTSIAGSYTSLHNDNINRLILYAPAWLWQPPVAPTGAPIAAYRMVAKDFAKARWLKGVSEDKQATLIPPGVFDAWWDATLATDPVGSKMNPPMLRAANGVFDEFINGWMAGKPYYDPGKITVPTLLIHAEWDADLPSYQAQAYFKQLTNVPYKRFVEIGEGTHTVMLEKNRMQFFREIMGFLSERDPLALR